MGLRSGDPVRIGDYRLIDRLGAGGMGTVFLGRSRSGRQVAVKLVHQQLAQDHEFRVRFRQEVAAARRVSGAFTAPVLDADPEAEQPWMATQFVPGPTLSSLVTAGGPLVGEELRKLALGLVEALRDIHAVGLVHRDLKPDNVLMTDDGPRVIDFGVSRAAEAETLTVTGRLIGTPAFMSPEQVRSPRNVTAASDVFALGAVFVYAATGNGPFDDLSPYLTAYRVVHEPPQVAALSGVVREIAVWCLANDSDERPSLTELQEALRAVPDHDLHAQPASRRSGGPSLVKIIPPAQPPERQSLSLAALRRNMGRLWQGWRHRRRLGVSAAAVAAVMCLVAVLAISGDASDRAEEAPEWRAMSAPDGWREWQHLFPVASGVPGCVAKHGMLFCQGGGVRMARVDPATGEFLWDIEETEGNQSPINSTMSGRSLLHFTHYSGGSTSELTTVAAGTGEVKWSRRIAAGSPVVAYEGGVMVRPADHKGVMSISPGSGRTQWRYDGFEECDFTASDGSPFVICDEGRPDRSRMVRRLDPKDGSSERVTPTDPYTEFLGEDDGEFYMADRTHLSVGRRDGPVRSVSHVEADGTGGGGRGVSPLPWAGAYLADEGVADGGVILTSRDGQILWYPGNGQQWMTHVGLKSISPPAVSAGQGVVYFHGVSQILALDLHHGGEIWQTEKLPVAVGQGGVAPQITMVKDVLVCAVGDRLYSLKPNLPRR